MKARDVPNGRWTCFLHITGHGTPVNPRSEFKNDEQAENWPHVSEFVTAIELMIRKGNMSGASSNSANEPHEPIAAAVDTSPVVAPLERAPSKLNRGDFPNSAAF